MNVYAKIYPAKNGDCFLISFGETEEEKKHLLIDCGYVDTFQKYLKDDLIKIGKSGGTLEKLILTHIDADHIQGAIRLLKDNNAERFITIKEVWHNTYRHLIEQKETEIDIKQERNLQQIIRRGYPQNESKQGEQGISAEQGTTVGALLLQGKYSWNSDFNNQAVCIEQRPKVALNADANICLLSPDKQKLGKLKNIWSDELKRYDANFHSANSQLYDDAFEMLLSWKKEKANVGTKQISATGETLEELLKTPFDEDDTATNGSSIAFVLQVQNKKLLFLGDAHPGANQIISLLRNINDENEKQLILEAVIEHINLMVRTDQHFYDRYEWLNKEADKVNKDEQDDHLIKFLIWFLNHPSLVVKNRVIETLVWLGSINPGIVLRALVKEILCDGYSISKELSVAIIHQLSNVNSDGFAENLKAALEEKEQELLKLNHFMIREAILASLIELKNNGITDLNDLIAKFEQTFATSNKSKGEIVLEEAYLEPISDPIYELNELNILTKQFAETLVGQVKVLVPLSIKDSRKASEYIDRSFNDHNDISLVSDFDTLLRYALNVAVYTCTTLIDREKVANILRFYQPTFPENKLTPQFNSSNEGFENAVKDFFETGNIAFDKLLVNNELPLNYYAKEHSESRRSAKEKIELTAYLIPVAKFSAKRHSYPWPTFSANGYPGSVSEEEEDVIPLFIKSEYAGNVIGSELVPAVMNAALGALIPTLKDNTNSVYWRKGRNWDNREQGVAEKTGYYITVTKDKIETLKSGYKLIWQISFGYKSRYIDVFEQKEIIR